MGPDGRFTQFYSTEINPQTYERDIARAFVREIEVDPVEAPPRLAGAERERPEQAPAGFEWDLWLGPAPARPYVEGVYLPFIWRGWWDFGTGVLGDIGYPDAAPYIARVDRRTGELVVSLGTLAELLCGVVVARLGVGDLVSFEGFVSEEGKRDLMRRSWATV